MEINRPLPGREPDTETGAWSDEELAASFTAFSGQFGGAG